jgi:membrane-associated phospholipid phosphatase
VGFGQSAIGSTIESDSPIKASLARLETEAVPPRAFEEPNPSPEPCHKACCPDLPALGPKCPDPKVSSGWSAVVGLGAGSLLGAALAEPAAGAPKRLGHVGGWDVVASGGALALVAAYELGGLGAQRPCREVSGRSLKGLDGWVREHGRWHSICSEDDAARASYATLFASIGLPLAYHAAGRQDERARDLAVTLEAGLVSAALVEVVKNVVSRPRPFVEFCEPTPRVNLCLNDSRKSFYSGHATIAFAMVTSGATVASMRGERHAGWLWGAGLTLAATTGYLRVAADRHHFSDVVVGAATGAAIGWATAKLHKTRAVGVTPARSSLPSPGTSAVALPLSVRVGGRSALINAGWVPGGGPAASFHVAW